MAIVAIAVVSPEGTVINTVAHDGTPFTQGTEAPAGWTPGVFPEGTLYVPVEEIPPPEPIEVGVLYDEATDTFTASVD